MKQWPIVSLISPVVCLVLCSCRTVPIMQNTQNIDHIDFMPFPISVYRDGVSCTIEFKYRAGSSAERNLGVCASYSYSTNDYINHFTSVTVWTDGKKRAIRSEEELVDIRTILTAACTSPSFLYYDRARYQMLEELKNYYFEYEDDVLCEVFADSDVLSVDLKAQKQIVTEYLTFHQLKYYRCNAQNVSENAKFILDLLEGVTFEEIRTEDRAGATSTHSTIEAGVPRHSSIEFQEVSGIGNGTAAGSD